MKKRFSQVRSTLSMLSQRKEGIVADYIPWLIIALAILVIISLSIFLLKGQGGNLMDKIKNLFGGI